jgi:hypothetical protein
MQQRQRIHPDIAHGECFDTRAEYVVSEAILLLAASTTSIHPSLLARERVYFRIDIVASVGFGCTSTPDCACFDHRFVPVSSGPNEAGIGAHEQMVAANLNGERHRMIAMSLRCAKSSKFRIAQPLIAFKRTRGCLCMPRPMTDGLDS